MASHLTSASSTAFDRGTDPILRFLSPEQVRQIADYQGEDTLRSRMEALAEKCTEGALTPEEKAEYQGYVRANNFIAVLQAKARKLLHGS